MPAASCLPCDKAHRILGDEPDGRVLKAGNIAILKSLRNCLAAGINMGDLCAGAGRMNAGYTGIGEQIEDAGRALICGGKQ